MNKETIVLNGREVSQKQLDKKKKEAEDKKGMKIVEISKNTYRTKLED